ncbi:MAG: hypothetical protein Q8N47_17175 [Bryobacterales bacterium]|nr:hypothetical protein [Bryobacterales bacterium]
MRTPNFFKTVTTAVWLLSGLSLMAVACFAQPGKEPVSAKARLQGAVIGEDGKALARAVVIYTRLPRYSRRTSDPPVPLPPGATVPGPKFPPPAGPRFITEPALARSVTADQNGVFDVGDLDTASYYLCAQVVGGGYLDPCKWSGIETLKLNPGQIRTGLQIKLKKGAILRFRIEDPKALLPKDSVVAAPHLIIGIRTETGAFHAAYTARQDATGRDLQLTVPFDTPLRLWVYSRHVKLTDTTGAVVDVTGAGPSIQLSPKDEVKQFTYVVTGPLQ